MRRRVHLTAVVLALAIVAAACGGSSSKSTTASGASSGNAIRLGFSAWPGWFPWQVAEEKGLFAKHGVNVKLTYFESYTDSLNALASGNLDANSQTLNDTVSSVAGGAKETIVLTNDNSTGNDQIIAAPGINSIADLKGKKVGAEQGTVDHYLLLLALKKAGLSPDDIQFQPLETGAAAAAFASGRLDAVGAFAPFTTQALARPGSKALATSADFPGAIPDHLVVNRDLVTSRPGDIQKLIDTWFDTLSYIKANPADAMAIMAKKGGVSVSDYQTYDKGTTIFSLDDNRTAFTPGATTKNLDFEAGEISKFLLGAKLIDKAPDLTGLFEPKFVNAAPATP
ncbi:MAG TPA: ABC transporter substrate-binding protein [Acidimicrobiales bacterium]|nr:ABC transporter substrate-binding protein [Acidimicrobiales bacterium]